MKLLILNQYFPPDRAATAILLGQLTESLGQKLDPTVICGSPTYNPETRDDLRPRPFKTRPVPLLPFSRGFMMVRLVNYVLFTLGSLARALGVEKSDATMCWTDPPWISWVGLAVKWIKKSKLILVYQDIYPEILNATGMITSTWLLRAIRPVFSFPMLFADKVVVIGEEMSPVLVKKGVPAHRLLLIENWQDTSLIHPADPKPFRTQHGLLESDFVIMHSGNIGFSQNLELLLESARLLKNESRIRFVLIGDGSRKSALERKIREARLDHVHLLPYQPESTLSESLAAANVHYMSLKEPFAGLIVPSKFYGIMAAARPVLAVLPEACSHVKTIRNFNLGFLCAPSAEELAKTIVSCMGNPSLLSEMGENARRYTEAFGNRSRATQAYLTAVHEA